MITTLCWVPRNSLRAVPSAVKPSEEEMRAMMEQLGMDDEEKAQPSTGASMEEDEGTDAKKGTVGDIAEELKMDDYDKEDQGVSMFLGGRNLTVHNSNSNDPYITAQDPDEDSEEDDAVISSTDFVLLAGHTEQEYSSVEVHVFDKEESSIYVHHNIVIPSFPLSTAYIRPSTASSGNDNAPLNFVAVGTFEPGIEIWNLDMVNAMEPTVCLGGREAPKPVTMSRKKRPGNKKKKGKKKKKGLKELMMGELKKGSHSAAVMTLSSNGFDKSCLASGSADNSVKIWDINTQACKNTFGHHSDKVQSVEWNPTEAAILLTGGYDGNACCLDIRDSKSIKRYKIDGEVQSMSWNPNNPAIFAASSDTGVIMFYDVRKGSQTKPLFTIGAHDGEVGGVCFNPSSRYPHMLASCSEDKTVKIWDLRSKPVCIEKKEMKIGQVLTIEFNKEDPEILAAGGSEGKVALWDIASSPTIVKKYPMPKTKK
mmetsp:Transcript_7124/g.11737  ORF Transcript_7124/g.11737 Transcript_7124/m.11737 type:complete len:481 (+) Transcript_7124:109-1551(+)